MLTVILGAIVIALGGIAYEIRRLRRFHEGEARQRERSRDAAELDETIRYLCPNLFYEHRDDLRDWFSISRGQTRSFAGYEKHVESGSPRPNDGLHWRSIHSRLLGDASDPERKKEIALLARLTEEFVKKGKEESRLTEPELDFVAFRWWKDAIDDGQADSRIVALPETEDHFSRLRARYRRPISE